MTDHNQKITQDSLIELLHSDHARFTQLMNRLNAEEQQKPFTPEGWSVKDFLAHMTHWKKLTHELVVALAHDQPFPKIPEATDERDEDELNEIQRQIYAPLPLAEVQANWEQVQTYLEHIVVDELDDRRLSEEVPAPWDEDIMIASGALIADMCDHDAKHFERIEEHFQLKA